MSDQYATAVLDSEGAAGAVCDQVVESRLPVAMRIANALAMAWSYFP